MQSNYYNQRKKQFDSVPHYLTDSGLLEPIKGTNGATNVRFLPGDSPTGIHGVADYGAVNTLVDNSVDTESNIYQNKIIIMNIGGITYHRKITANLQGTFIFGNIVAGVAATCKVGLLAAGEITITAAVTGTAANAYTVVFAAAEATGTPLAAVLTGNVLTVTLAVDVGLAITSTATEVAAAIDALDEFTAIKTGATDGVLETAEPVALAGGVDAIGVVEGVRYQII